LIWDSLSSPSEQQEVITFTCANRDQLQKLHDKVAAMSLPKEMDLSPICIISPWDVSNWLRIPQAFIFSITSNALEWYSTPEADIITQYKWELSDHWRKPPL